jgi:hypothetical protein
MLRWSTSPQNKTDLRQSNKKHKNVQDQSVSPSYTMYIDLYAINYPFAKRAPTAWIIALYKLIKDEGGLSK